MGVPMQSTHTYAACRANHPQERGRTRRRPEDDADPYEITGMSSAPASRYSSQVRTGSKHRRESKRRTHSDQIDRSMLETKFDPPDSYRAYRPASPERSSRRSNHNSFDSFQFEPLETHYLKEMPLPSTSKGKERVLSRDSRPKGRQLSSASTTDQPSDVDSLLMVSGPHRSVLRAPVVSRDSAA